MFHLIYNFKGLLDHTYHVKVEYIIKEGIGDIFCQPTDQINTLNFSPKNIESIKINEFLIEGQNIHISLGIFHPGNLNFKICIHKVFIKDISISENILNLENIELSFTLPIIKSANKDMLYVTGEFTDLVKFPSEKLDVYMRPYFNQYFDIFDVTSSSINDLDMTKYKVVLVNAIIFSPRNYKMFANKISFVRNIPKVILLLHDLHDYTFNRKYKRSATVTAGNIKIMKPVLKDNLAKKYYWRIFNNFNVKYLISLCDCPEFDFFRGYFKNIEKFYVINHGYPSNIYYPISSNKTYDVLFYGSDMASVYPLRVRLYQLLGNANLRFRKIEKGENIYEYSLCKLINQSWICIACISNFSYFVRKYLEISACNSVVIGDINHQGYQIIGSNMIYVTNIMTDQEIIEKINYYLENKEILSAISYQKLENVSNKNYTKVAENKTTICQSIKLNSDCIFECPKQVIANNLELDSKKIHQKEPIDVNFTTSKFNENYIMFSSQKLEEGVYTIVYHFNIYNETLDIYDDTNKRITDRNTYVRDQQKLYISFVLKTKSPIRICTNADLAKNYSIFKIHI